MRGRRLLAALAATFAIAGGATASAQAATITMSGSTSVAPLAQLLAQEYVKKNKGTKFAILQGGSDIGISDVSRGRVTIGMSSRDPKAADPGGIVFNKFARDSICIVTNPKNPIPALSQSALQNIFSGRIRSWSQVDGSTQSGSINLVTRTPASGTFDSFQNIIMGEDLRVAQSADAKSSNGLQAQAIKSDPLAIGYASFSFVQGLHNVPYEGVPCTLRNAKSGQYGAIRNFWFVTRGPAKGDAKKFIEFTRKDKKAQKIISTDWVPLR
jgi:phosphate transport system substrate-binding protein